MHICIYKNFFELVHPLSIFAHEVYTMGMQKWESPDGEDRKSNSKVCSCCL
jgi:hypothetical protein